jgi:hypothetical protein
MAITIRNKGTEAMIRRLAEQWGSGPSGVIKRLVEHELQRTGAVPEAEFQRRMNIWDELDREFPPPTEEEKSEMQYELDHMYDYLEEENDRSESAKKSAAS